MRLLQSCGVPKVPNKQQVTWQSYCELLEKKASNLRAKYEKQKNIKKVDQQLMILSSKIFHYYLNV